MHGSFSTEETVTRSSVSRVSAWTTETPCKAVRYRSDIKLSPDPFQNKNDLSEVSQGTHIVFRGLE